MKTKIITLLFFFFIFFLTTFSFSLAQDLQLQNINLSFCNSWETSNELDLTTKAWEKTPICIIFSNTSSKEITINVDFLDSMLTQDQPWKELRACNAADRPKQYFANFVLNYENSITIPWNSTVQKTYQIKFPAGFKWISHWCVAYNEIQPNNQLWKSMLNIIVRKVKFIDIFVWDTQIKSQIKLWSIKTIKNWNIINFKIWLNNIWNVDQNTIISWTISNIFWYKEILNFDKNNFTLLSDEETIIQTNNKNLNLPAYKWFFKIEFNIINKPILNFNISTENQSPKDVILWWTFKVHKLFFIPNRYFIWIVIIFLTLIYLALFKKKEKKSLKHNKS